MDRGKFPPALSLGVTFALIAAGIGYSLWKTRGESEPDWPAEPERPERGREGRSGVFGGVKWSATARFEALTPLVEIIYRHRNCLIADSLFLYSSEIGRAWCRAGEIRYVKRR